MSESKITIYGAYWCPDCRRAKKFLGEQFVPFKWIDIEQDKEAEQYVLQKNNGKRIIPTIVFEDDSFLVEPSNAELAKKLGLKTEAKKTYYDLIIIGGGPAGVAAGVYAARKRLRTVLIAGEIGGQSVVSEGIENWIGTPKISGADLAKSFKTHIDALSAGGGSAFGGHTYIHKYCF